MPPHEGQLELDLYPVDGAAPVPAAPERCNPERARDQARRAVEATDVEDAAGSVLLTTREVAAVLHVHPRTVQRLVERGELSVVRLGSAVRFDPSDLGGLISRFKERTRNAGADVADSVRARTAAHASFADRLRSQTA
jgi:excisionase family DNA binding protein